MFISEVPFKLTFCVSRHGCNSDLRSAKLCSDPPNSWGCNRYPQYMSKPLSQGLAALVPLHTLLPATNLGKYLCRDLAYHTSNLHFLILDAPCRQLHLQVVFTVHERYTRFAFPALRSMLLRGMRLLHQGMYNTRTSRSLCNLTSQLLMGPGNRRVGRNSQHSFIHFEIYVMT